MAVREAVARSSETASQFASQAPLSEESKGSQKRIIDAVNAAYGKNAINIAQAVDLLVQNGATISWKSNGGLASKLLFRKSKTKTKQVNGFDGEDRLCCGKTKIRIEDVTAINGVSLSEPKKAASPQKTVLEKVLEKEEDESAKLFGDAREKFDADMAKADKIRKADHLDLMGIQALGSGELYELQGNGPLASKNFRLAVSYFEKELALMPEAGNDPSSCGNIGLAYYHVQNYRKALPYLMRGVRDSDFVQNTMDVWAIVNKTIAKDTTLSSAARAKLKAEVKQLTKQAKKKP